MTATYSAVAAMSTAVESEPGEHDGFGGGHVRNHRPGARQASTGHWSWPSGQPAGPRAWYLSRSVRTWRVCASTASTWVGRFRSFSGTSAPQFRVVVIAVCSEASSVASLVVAALQGAPLDARVADDEDAA